MAEVSRDWSCTGGQIPALLVGCQQPHGNGEFIFRSPGDYTISVTITFSYLDISQSPPVTAYTQRIVACHHFTIYEARITQIMHGDTRVDNAPDGLINPLPYNHNTPWNDTFKVKVKLDPQPLMWGYNEYAVAFDLRLVDVDRPGHDSNDNVPLPPFLNDRDGDGDKEPNRGDDNPFPANGQFWAGEGEDNIGMQSSDVYRLQLPRVQTEKEFVIPVPRGEGDNFVIAVAGYDGSGFESNLESPYLNPLNNPFGGGTETYAEDVSREFTIIAPIDIDVDSDNTNFTPDYGPDNTVAEEPIEENEPGRFVLSNSDDDDEDSVLDALDGFNYDGLSDTPEEQKDDRTYKDETHKEDDFVLMTLRFHERQRYLLDDGSKIMFNYSGANLRVWNLPGSEPRKSSGPPAGNLVYPGFTYEMGDLVLGPYPHFGTQLNLWLEGMNPSPNTSGHDVEVFYDVDADDNWDYSDVVKVMVGDFRILIDHDLLVIDNLTKPAEGILDPPMVPDETVLHLDTSPYLQTIENLTPAGNPHEYEYSFWVTGAVNRIKVYEDISGQLYELTDLAITAPRWNTISPGGFDLPDLPNTLIVKTNGLHSNAYQDIVLHFQATNINGSGAPLLQLPETTRPITVAQVDQFEIFDKNNTCNRAPVYPYEKRAVGQDWDHVSPLPPQVDKLLMGWNDAEEQTPQMGVRALIEPAVQPVLDRFAWTYIAYVQIEIYHSQGYHIEMIEQQRMISPFMLNGDIAFGSGSLPPFGPDNYDAGTNAFDPRYMPPPLIMVPVSYSIAVFPISLRANQDGDKTSIPSSLMSQWNRFEREIRALQCNVIDHYSNVESRNALLEKASQAQSSGMILAPPLLRHFTLPASFPLAVNGVVPFTALNSAKSCYTCLTHDAGKVFPISMTVFDCTQCTTPITVYDFPSSSGTPPAETYTSMMFGESPQVKAIIWHIIKKYYGTGENTTLSQLLEIVQNPYERIPLSDTLNDGGWILDYTPWIENLGQTDLTFAWGEGLIKNITLTNVEAWREVGEGGDSFHISFNFDATGYDLYDFDFWDAWPAPHAAKIQAYGSPMDNEGVIFYAKYSIIRHDSLAWFGGNGPTDTSVYPYKCSMAYYTTGD